MIEGVVNGDLEAAPEIVFADSTAILHEIPAIIDTGFTGELTLPPEIIERLRLTWIMLGKAYLADGSIDRFNIYVGKILWDGVERMVFVEGANTTPPLVGMKLLSKHRLQFDVVPNGRVLIKAMHL